MLAQNSAHNSQTVTKNVLSLTKTQLVSLDRAIDNCHVWRTHTQIDFRKREWGKKTNPPSMILFLWKLFEIYFWLCVMLRGYFEDETLLVLSFPFPSSPARFFPPPSPQLPYETKRPLRRRERGWSFLSSTIQQISGKSSLFLSWLPPVIHNAPDRGGER